MLKWNGKTSDKFVKFYHSSAWKQARRIALARDHYLCQECYRQGRITPASTVHHIYHLRDYWDKRLDLDNLETICLECHNKEHPEKGANNKAQAIERHKQHQRKDIFKFEANDDDPILF
ncbi:HNH endonuclease [Bombilactobacillus bombi]|uniref:HNH endonuclease n=1 Tax=Bombilactobacillus bombi TaxID=1303590 RepID=UPI0021755F42|nr:HNH endonuclease signature motif containing protein [Bombilactobacillus bombi]